VLTVDRNSKHQQSPASLPITVVVMIAQSNRLKDLLPLVPAVEQALLQLPQKTLVEIALPTS
jgi:hypothetical protein